MATRRERLERRLALRLEWAQKRSAEADARYRAARRSIEHIPPGQPILVGHHSERHHRADLARHDSNMRAACAASDMRDKHVSRADGIEAQLENSIFSDDEDAIERLQEKLAALEERRELIKRINAAWRKAKRPASNDDAGWGSVAALVGIPLESRIIAEGRRNQIYCWSKSPFAPYVSQNLGGNITRCRKRIDEVKRRNAVAAKAEASGGLVIARSSDNQYTSITFSEKPERAVLDALKSAGFYWRGGSWSGRVESIPECVLEMEREAKGEPAAT
jgi:hypothetical protein